MKIINRIDIILEAIKIDEEIKIKNFSIYEILKMLSETEKRDDILSRLDKETIEKLRKMEEGGLI